MNVRVIKQYNSSSRRWNWIVQEQTTFMLIPYWSEVENFLFEKDGVAFAKKYKQEEGKEVFIK